MPLSVRDLISIADLTDHDIRRIMTRADTYADLMKRGERPDPVLSGRVMMSLFFENSTRTRVSFEMAALRLGMSVLNWDEANSSTKKGETLLDTIQTLNTYAPDAIVVRHSEYNAPYFVAKNVDCPVLNAGDSWREHPTQALLDALTLKRHFGKIEGLTVAICGDVAHSRVAGSDMILLTRLGAKVRIVAPHFLMPQKFPVEGIESFETLEDGLPGCDAVMMLRIQKERMDSSLIPSELDYFHQYGLTQDRLALANRDAVILHPGPINRNVEIADDVADDPRRSLILTQVGNGLFVRMAALELLCGKAPG